MLCLVKSQEHFPNISNGLLLYDNRKDKLGYFATYVHENIDSTRSLKIYVRRPNNQSSAISTSGNMISMGEVTNHSQIMNRNVIVPSAINLSSNMMRGNEIPEYTSYHELHVNESDDESSIDG